MKPSHTAIPLLLIALNCNSESKQQQTHANPHTPQTIAYFPIKTNEIKLYTQLKKGTPQIKSINADGGYLAWSPDGKQFAYYAKYDDKKTWSIHTMNVDGTADRPIISDSAYAVYKR